MWRVVGGEDTAEVDVPTLLLEVLEIGNIFL